MRPRRDLPPVLHCRRNGDPATRQTGDRWQTRERVPTLATGGQGRHGAHAGARLHQPVGGLIGAGQVLELAVVGADAFIEGSQVIEQIRDGLARKRRERLGRRRQPRAAPRRPDRGSTAPNSAASSHTDAVDRGGAVLDEPLAQSR